MMWLKKSVLSGDEEIMELIWKNGQVVEQSQSQRHGDRKPNIGEATSSGEIRSIEEAPPPPPPNLLMQEDEMASWLHYPNDESFDRHVYSNLPYPPSTLVSASPVSFPSSLPTTSAVTVAAARPPPIPPSWRVREPTVKHQNFLNFYRPRMVDESIQSTSNKPAKDDITVADSNETPAVNWLETSTEQVSGGNNIKLGTRGTAGTSTEAMNSCELNLKSSPGTEGSGGRARASGEQSSQSPSATVVVDRKLKDREDIGFECNDGKKQGCGSTSAKRPRAVEVHNQSERRRRDRINEKMKALQELIPRCNKSDKASMLDEAIEYLKSLQMQVQMMSMGCSTVPLMFPGVQQYMPPMAMGMGMLMGMNQGIVPYPSVLPGSVMPPSAAAATHMPPQFPVPAFQMPPLGQVSDPSRIRASTSIDPMMNPLVPQNPNQVRMQHSTDPFQHYLSIQQQKQTLTQPGVNKPSSSKEVGNPENRPTG